MCGGANSGHFQHIFSITNLQFRSCLIFSDFRFTKKPCARLCAQNQQLFFCAYFVLAKMRWLWKNADNATFWCGIHSFFFLKLTWENRIKSKGGSSKKFFRYFFLFSLIIEKSYMKNVFNLLHYFFWWVRGDVKKVFVLGDACHKVGGHPLP